MTYENIKSVILVILVCFSILLTWSIWTYQPNLEVMTEQNTVEKVAISDKKDVGEIVKPDRIFYHLDKEKHFGTVNTNEINKVIAEISKWNYADFENMSGGIENFSSFIHNSGKAVIEFPDLIPIDLYRSIIDIKDKKLPNFQFDRIVIDVDGTSKEQSYVYFISAKEKKAFRSHVASSFVNNFNNAFFKNVEYNSGYLSYFPYKVSNERVLFLPSNETKMLRYQYITKPLDYEKYKNALFTNPSVVQKNHQSSGVEFKDYSSLMRVNYDKNTLSYVNPAESNEKPFPADNLLKRSIDFVNEHGGWTGNYQYVKVDESSYRVLFRLYESNGYPVFSDANGISEISHTWGQNEILEYSRSNFSFGIQTDSSETTLQSGQEVIEKLERMEGVHLNQVQNIVIGYTMKKDLHNVLVYLEPAWYYEYNDTWNKISFDEIEGGNHGLE
ncbi:YycH family regulatory protein [Cytobacillus massiliigabonensis]|uniref:YycH family regulatory protein n=1 Tax=Cytobacillus massiliigabonensis TaxID=1871011 RepID=UPI000C84FF03|nr:two-component system activity regulator YycH [Cytobacillus massiliigabonensis]